MSDTGLGSIDLVTNQGGVQVSGLEADGVWSYSTDGGANWFASRSGTDTSLSVLGDDSQTVWVRQTDVAGNVSEVGSLSFELDTVAPSIPVLNLEEIQDQLIRGTLRKTEKRPAMSAEELSAAMTFLTSPTLMQQLLLDFDRCGIVGEEANKQVAYLAAVSRKLEKPLAVMVQSSSAAGKSSLMEAVLKFVPDEERIQYSAMTGQSLFYLGEKDLKHKILAISEEEGAQSASYALKLLQSEGVVSIASTGKNATTGNLETQEYKVEGPVMLFSTTTAIDPDKVLLSSFVRLITILLAVSSSLSSAEPTPKISIKPCVS